MVCLHCLNVKRVLILAVVVNWFAVKSQSGVAGAPAEGTIGNVNTLVLRVLPMLQQSGALWS